VLAQTIPLLFAADCWFMDFDEVRALVVLPELPVAAGAVGAPASVVPDELDDCRLLPVESAVLPDESLVRALVVLPEFAPAVGSFVEFADAELEVLPESFDVAFDFLLPVVLVLGVSPVGGVALAEGSAAALFFVLPVAVGAVFVFSALVELSVPAAPVFLLDLVFFEVVEASPELVCVEFAASEESAAGFFFFLAVESLCDWSVDCVD
jgi:hypothetical protein